MTGPAAPFQGLEVEALSQRFGRAARVLDGVSLKLPRGKVVGLIGASGTGKSTLARCIAGLLAPAAGRLALDGRPLGMPRTREQRRAVQYVWQEPQAALDPRWSVLRSALEPLEGFGLAHGAEALERASAMLGSLGLSAAAVQRRPHELSGGQCQRAVLARALLARPSVLLLDEPFSALDTVTTAALMRELATWLDDRPMSVLFVSHDQAAVRRLAQRTLRLRQGRLDDVSPNRPQP
jgi:ABC-type glutathione transport system ATPase component